MPEPEPDVKALFVTQQTARAGYYRCVLPAMFGGWHWAAIAGKPPGLSLLSSWVHQQTRDPDFLEYDVVVLQQPRGAAWAGLIRKLRSQGVVVLYEVDDYVHGIRAALDHDFRGFYSKDHLKDMELCARTCDGMIVSTQFLADKYRRLARDRPIWVCENGLDMGRYRLTRPSRGEVNGRETVTIMWSGATGHQVAALPWLVAVRDVLNDVPHTSFVSVGQDFAKIFADEFPERVLSIPFTSLECYPAAMMAGDVSIAPAGNSDWYRAKSQLRAMESAALGIPVVADELYSEAVVDGETGLLVSRASRVSTAIKRLVEDDDLRERMGVAARAKAVAEFDMRRRVGQWECALAEATRGRS